MTTGLFKGPCQFHKELCLPAVSKKGSNQLQRCAATLPRMLPGSSELSRGLDDDCDAQEANHKATMTSAWFTPPRVAASTHQQRRTQRPRCPQPARRLWHQKAALAGGTSA